jgi:S-adenosylmethionine:tRNA ribosyltransferase-isomerase
MDGLAFAPATHARPIRETRLLVIRVGSGEVREAALTELPALLEPGDVMVVNDAATLPASIFGVTKKDVAIELRLLALPDPARTCDAVVFGAGDWHTPTEHRARPPVLSPGDGILVGGLDARVLSCNGRVVRLRFERDRDELIAALYRAGRPVQYAHMEGALPLWDVQNVYASEPWAAEMPSAGRPLDFAALDALRKRGVAVARLTHGAGLSSIGTAEEDASLPWTERYRIPEETAALVNRAPRVIAVGTSVVRALESAATEQGVRAGEGTTSLRIDGSWSRRPAFGGSVGSWSRRPAFGGSVGHRLQVTGGLLTGMHDATTSHADLLQAFISPTLLADATRFALARGFLGHELGDSCLILN